MVTLEKIWDAQNALRGVARVTPLNPAKALGKNVYIKCENLQLTGAFKLRGAYNKLRSLTEEERARGVIACSAGNHAQGIALSATRLGMKSVICMPAGAPISKIEATRNYGAEVVLVPGVYDDAAAEAARLAEEHGYTFAHPFNDPAVMAGQGTIGLEILEQLPEVEQVIVPIGGGGLISGIACAIKSIRPSCRVIGVQAEGAASMLASRQAGHPVELPGVSTIADGIAVKLPGELTFAMCERYVDEIVTVRDDEIATGILALMEDQKIVAEGAGATPIAAVLFDKVDVSEKKTVCLVSGGNVDGWVATVALTVGEGLGTGLSAQPQRVQARKMAGMIRFRIFNSPPPGNHSILSNYISSPSKQQTSTFSSKNFLTYSTQTSSQTTLNSASEHSLRLDIKLIYSILAKSAKGIG